MTRAIHLKKLRFEVLFSAPGMVGRDEAGRVTSRSGTPHQYDSWQKAWREAKRWMERGVGWEVQLTPMGPTS